MLKPARDILGAIIYLTCTAASLMGAFLLRFDYVIPARETPVALAGLYVFAPAKMVVFWAFRLHRKRWNAVSMHDLLRLLLANVCASMLATACTIFVVGPSFSRSVYAIDFVICLVLTGGMQCAMRLYRESIAGIFRQGKPGRKNILVYGAGSAGAMLAREVRQNPTVAYRIVGFIDDDPSKIGGTVLGGHRVLGAGRDVPRIVAHQRRRGTAIDQIVIAMPSAGGSAMREALANCRSAGIPSKTIPGLSELLEHQVLTRQIRDISVIDLLGRQPVSLDEAAIAKEITDKSVMVTGGGGSIGSELCRQIARFHPRTLVVLDQAESTLFFFERELRSQFPSIEIAAQIGDIRNQERIREILDRHSVDAVFHAAAYKHVPMMERSIIDAVENNVLGTLNVASAALQAGCSRFLMISSDKAVNPASIMGLTKRVAEVMVSTMPFDRSAGTRFISVRFGNVLGSNGSVVPIFQQQIAAGGPVTITHPEMRRYFMTIPEAVQLVLQAYSMGRGSEIFVLDMGEPIRILDLARNMIRLAGLEPEKDIEIRFTGLRPGEKLFEELRLNGENILATYHEKIKIFQSPGPSREYMKQWVGELRAVMRMRESRAVLAHLAKLVPEYRAISKDASESKALAAAIGD